MKITRDVRDIHANIPLEYSAKHPCENLALDECLLLKMSPKKREDGTADLGMALDPSRMGEPSM